MKRRVIQRRVVVFLLLLLVGGAIVNVAVAWGCAAYVRVTEIKYIEGHYAARTNGNPYWVFHIYKGFGSCQVSSRRYVDVFRRKMDERPQLRPSWSRIQVPPVKHVSIEENLSSTWLIEDARGWPFLAMRYQFTSETINTPLTGSSHGDYRTIYKTTDGLLLARNRPRDAARALPLVPIWPDFAINTIFYAAILWVVFFVPGKLKRMLRRRRGLCPACGYPVGTSPVCTECGGPVGKRPNVKTSKRQNVETSKRRIDSQCLMPGAQCLTMCP